MSRVSLALNYTLDYIAQHIAPACAELTQRFGLWLMWYLAPIKTNVATVLTLVVADVVTGVWASFKKGKKFESKTLRKTVSKGIGYLAFIVLSLLVEPFAPDSIPVVKVVTGFIVWTEFQSIVIENLSVITGVDLWAALRGKLTKAGTAPEPAGAGLGSESSASDQAPRDPQ